MVLPGQIVATGDGIFPANSIASFSRFFYLWDDNNPGAGALTPSYPAFIPHAGLFYIMSLFGFADNQIQTTNFFLILFFTAVSAYAGFWLLFKNNRQNALFCFVISVFYTFNHFMLDASLSLASYLMYYEIYIFLPIMWAAFVKGVQSGSLKWIVVSAFLAVISVSGYSNPAFLLALFLFFTLTAFFLFLFGGITAENFFKGLLFIPITGTALSFYLLPYANFYITKTIYSQLQPAENLREWIKGQSAPIIELLRLSRGWPIFPTHFPYKSIFFLKPVFIFLSFYPAVFLVAGSFFYKKQHRWLFATASGLLFVYIFGAAKAKISIFLSQIIFSAPLMCALRSVDKFYVFLPFIFALFLALFLDGVFSNNKFSAFKKKTIVSILTGVILLYAFPFFRGGFHRDVSFNHVWNYEFDTMVKVPGYYEAAGNYLKLKQGSFKILNMPYTGRIGTGWVLYPKWKYIGVDFTTLYFYPKPVLNPIENQYQFGLALPFHLRPEQGSRLLTPMAKLYGVRYMIMHRDVRPQYQEPFEKVLKDTKNDWDKIAVFGDLEIYELRDTRPLFYISWPASTFRVIAERFDETRQALMWSALLEAGFVNNATILFEDENKAIGLEPDVFCDIFIYSCCDDFFDNKLGNCVKNIKLGRGQADIFVGKNTGM